MKLNNKGFAISSIMYIILIMAVILISVTLAILSSRKLILDKIKKETADNIYGISYNSVINTLKYEAISYAINNNIEQENIKIGDFETSVSQKLLEHHELLDKYLTLYKNNYGYDVYLGQTKKITDISKPIDNMIGIVDYKIYGNSYQETSSGKNLFDATKIKNTNIKIENNGQKITLPIHTSSNGNTNTLSTLSELCPKLKVGDEVILNFEMNTDTNNFIYLLEVKDLWYLGTSRTITQEMLDSTVFLYGNRYEVGDEVQKIITNFQIEKGTTATEYEEYRESPSPEFPSEIKSVGDKTKNSFLDVVNREQEITYEKYKNGYKVSSTTPASAYMNYISFATDIKNGWGKTYTISSYLNMSNPNMNSLMRVGYWKKGAYTWNDFKYTTITQDSINSITIQLPSEIPEDFDENFGICLLFNIQRSDLDNIGTLTITDIMIEEGTKPTEYEPYGYKIPVKVRGKNLFDLNSAIIDGGILEGNTINSNKDATDIDLYLKKGTYSIKFNKQDIEKVFLRNGQVSSSFFKQVTSDDVITFTFEEDEYLRISYFLNGGKISDIMLVEGSYTNETMPNYEPYIQPVINNIYLNEPLRKIEDYKDSLEFGASKEVRKIRNGKIEELTTYIPSKKSSVCWFTMNNNGLKEQIPDSVVQSPIFKSLQEIWWQDKEGIISHKTNSKGIYFSLSWRRLGLIFDGTNVYSEEDVEKTTPLNDTDLYNIGDEYVINKLSEDKKNIYYQLNTPIEEDLILPKINMNNGQSNIEVDTNIQPSNVEFTIIENIRKL